VRIVLVGAAYPLRGGIAHYIALLYRALEERGHDVHVLSFKKQYPSLFFPGKTQWDEGEELIAVDSVPILDPIHPLSWMKAFFWLKEMRPDLLIFKYWMPFFAPCYAAVAFLAKAFLGAKVLFILDNVVPHEKKIADGFLTRIGLRFVDFFIAQSETVLRDLLRFRPMAVYKEVPHPVYEIFPSPISKEEARKKLRIDSEHVILYFGYIRAYKGLKYLIEAMPRVWDAMRVCLLICGEVYEGREELVDLIDRIDTDRGIRMMDRFIPNEEVGLFFCASDLVVLPYVTATQSGIVQIAYHYDKPAVVTDVGGLPEVVLDGRTGYVVPSRNPEALAEAVLRFYREHKEAQFVRNVREEKQKYTWSRMAEAVESFMKEG
jgi:glycosyltransferase involved in cell wall biosynthesis